MWNGISKVPFGLFVAAVVSLLSDHDIIPGGAVPYLSGLLCLLIVIIILKRASSTLFGSPVWSMRPSSCNHVPSPGMPSSHSACMSYSFFLFALADKCPPLNRKKRAALLIAIGILSILVGMSRISLHCHTPLQVIIGFAVGAPLAVCINAASHQM